MLFELFELNCKNWAFCPVLGKCRFCITLTTSELVCSVKYKLFHQIK